MWSVRFPHTASATLRASYLFAPGPGAKELSIPTLSGPRTRLRALANPAPTLLAMEVN